MAAKPDKAAAPADSVYTVLHSLSVDIGQRLKVYEAMRKSRRYGGHDELRKNLFYLLEQIEQQLDKADPILSDKTGIGAGVYTAYVGLRNEITTWRRKKNAKRNPNRASVRYVSDGELWELIEHTRQQLCAIGPELNQQPVAALARRKGLPDRITFGEPSRDGKVVIAGHFPPAVQAELRQIADQEETTTQKLLAEALNLLFAKRGRKKVA
jgi:hypothetical protein